MSPAECEDQRVIRILRGEETAIKSSPPAAPRVDLLLDRALGLPPPPWYRLAIDLAREQEDARVLALLGVKP